MPTAEDLEFQAAVEASRQAIKSLTLNDPVVKLLREQVADAKPEAPRTPFSLKRHTRFLFRTRPGTLRKPKFKIPGIPAAVEAIEEFQGIKVIKNYGPRFKQLYDRKHTPAEREFYAQVREDNMGQDYIEFTEIPMAFEAYYETNSEAIAEFLRERIAKTRMGQYIYEDLGIQMLKSRYTAEEFPNTEQGRAQLFAFDRKIEKMMRDAIAATPAEEPEETGVVTNVPVPPQDVTQDTAVPEQPTAQGQGKTPITEAVTPVAEAVTPVTKAAPKAAPKKG